jgi:hypothetical protein
MVRTLNMVQSTSIEQVFYSHVLHFPQSLHGSSEIDNMSVQDLL